jgi:hypothetical protein
VHDKALGLLANTLKVHVLLCFRLLRTENAISSLGNYGAPPISYSSNGGGPSNTFYSSNSGGPVNSYSSNSGGPVNSYSSNSGGPSYILYSSGNSGPGISSSSGGLTNSYASGSDGFTSSSGATFLLDNNIGNPTISSFQSAPSSSFLLNTNQQQGSLDEPLILDNSIAVSAGVGSGGSSVSGGGVLNLNPPIQYYVNEPMPPRSEALLANIKGNINSNNKQLANPSQPIVIHRFKDSQLREGPFKDDGIDFEVVTGGQRQVGGSSSSSTSIDSSGSISSTSIDNSGSSSSSSASIDSSSSSSSLETSGIRPAVLQKDDDSYGINLRVVEAHAQKLANIKLTTTATATANPKTAAPDTSSLFLDGGGIFSDVGFNLFNFGEIKPEIKKNCK